MTNTLPAPPEGFLWYLHKTEETEVEYSSYGYDDYRYTVTVVRLELRDERGVAEEKRRVPSDATFSQIVELADKIMDRWRARAYLDQLHHVGDEVALDNDSSML